jgi:hypothetical protein
MDERVRLSERLDLPEVQGFLLIAACSQSSGVCASSL